MILSISKSLFLLFVMVACSSSAPEQREDSQEKEVVVKRPEIFPGPRTPKSPVFIDKTKEYGLEGATGTNFYAVDLNNNGDTDLVVLPNHFSIPKFYYFNSKLNKFELSDEEHLPFGTRASFLAFYDFNNDGIRDLLVVTLNQKTALNPRPIELYEGSIKENKLYFERVEGAFSGKDEPVASLIPLDYDLDGKLDLYQANWFDTRESHNASAEHDRFYIGEEKFEFVEKTAKLVDEAKYNSDRKRFLNAKPTFSAALCDVDQNGYPDILTSSSEGETDNMWLNLYSQEFDQRVFQNFGEQTGYDQDSIGELMPRGAGHGLFSICTDYNNNGLIDILKSELSHSYDPESRDRSSILTGKNKGFPPEFFRSPYEVTDDEETWTHSGKRGLFVDLNFDGLIDIVADNSGFPPETRLIAFAQEEDHAFVDVAQDWGIDIMNPSGTVAIDINKDGRMDLISGQVNIRDERIEPRLYVFENNVPRQGRRTLRIYPKGVQSHPHALGAKVVLETERRKQTRLVSYSEGPLPSQNEEGIYLGLAKDEKPKSLEVTWPTVDQDSNGPLVVNYDLRFLSTSELRYENYIELVVCEDGQIFKGRKSSCPSE